MYSRFSRLFRHQLFAATSTNIIANKMHAQNEAYRSPANFMEKDNTPYRGEYPFPLMKESIKYLEAQIAVEDDVKEGLGKTLFIFSQQGYQSVAHMMDNLDKLADSKIDKNKQIFLLTKGHTTNSKLSEHFSVNYDKYQYVDTEQPLTTHLPQQVLIHNNNTQILNTRSSKDDVVNDGYKRAGDWGEYIVLVKDNKKYLKHKWKNEPIKDYK